ncbi:porin [Paraburkholderia mimosarum]|uniref:porin n=1 Tax=Paraburkholderia mimosarum TaxID=312026 RepID=UPI0039C47093
MEKRRFLAAGAILVSCASGVPCAVNAQSTVALYGALDVGIDYINNSGGKSLVRMRDGTYDGMYGSRWGLRGEEDLGGGLKAIFRLESGFSVEDGQSRQGGLLFGRQAFVGLLDQRFGTVTFGRQYDSIVDYIQPLTAAGQFGGPFVHAGDIDNTDNSFRVNNAIKYASPSFFGLTFGGMYSFTNTNAAGRGTTGMWSVGVSYEKAGLSLAGAYFYAKDPALLFADGNFIGNTTGSAIGASGPFSYVGNPKNEQIIGAGGSYSFGKAAVGIDYTDTKFDNANGTTSSVRFDNYEAWAKYSITPAAMVGAAYVYTHGEVNYNGETPKYHQVGLMGSYSLSKRTTLYAMGAFQKAAGSATRADIFDYAIASASTTDRQLMFRLGVTHLF